MYTRDFGGIKSDGQLREYEEMLRKQRENDSGYVAHSDSYDPAPRNDEPQSSSGLFGLPFLKNISLEDIILLAIGALLLFDIDKTDDILVILIILLLIL